MLALFKPPYDLYMLCAYLGVGFLMLRSCVRHYRMTLAANEGRFTGGHLVTLKASTSLGLAAAWVTWTAIGGTLLGAVASGLVWLVRR